MQILNSTIDLSKYHLSPKKGGSARAELVGQFMDLYNASTTGKKHTAARMGFRLSHITSEHELYAFLQDCKGAKCFAAYFNYCLNPARHE